MKRKSLRGQNVMLWLNSKVIALSLSCKLQLAATTEDGGTKDDGDWDAPEVVSRKWSMSNESFDSADKGTTNDQVYNDLFDLFISDEPIEITLGIPTNQSKEGVPEGGWIMPAGTSESPIYKGKALISALDRDDAKGGKSKITVSLEGVGALLKDSGAA